MSDLEEKIAGLKKRKLELERLVAQAKEGREITVRRDNRVSE